MDSASRLYERLGQIPQDPSDPDSLEDLLVCAFGAFERYYVCWKTRGGQYRQDGYDLPEALYEWLFPSDGSTRDFPTLQVVFGRGDEYFASDKNGKLEFKEPEVKKPQTPVEPVAKEERPGMKRSRTTSFLRPLSDSSTKSSNLTIDSPITEPSNRRSSSISQLSSRRSPSNSFSKPISEPMYHPQSPVYDAENSQASSRRSSFISQPASQPLSISSRPNSDTIPRSFSPVIESQYAVDTPTSALAPPRLARRSTRPLSMSFNSGTFPKIVEGKTLSSENSRDSDSEHHCPCCRHNPASKPKYANASVQTDPEPLRLDTSSDVLSYSSYSNRASALDVDTPLTEELPPPPAHPFSMGRMLDYFGNPRYQLGDSLMSSYYYFQQPVYEYQEEVMYDEAGGWKEGVAEIQTPG